MPKGKVLATITIEYCEGDPDKKQRQVHVSGPVDQVDLYRHMIDTCEKMVEQVHQGNRIIKPSLNDMKTIGGVT